MSLADRPDNNKYLYVILLLGNCGGLNVPADKGVMGYQEFTVPHTHKRQCWCTHRSECHDHRLHHPGVVLLGVHVEKWVDSEGGVVGLRGQ